MLETKLVKSCIRRGMRNFLLRTVNVSLGRKVLACDTEIQSKLSSSDITFQEEVEIPLFLYGFYGFRAQFACVVFL